MGPLELATVGLVLLATLCLGTIVHELAHAVVLRAFGIEHDIDWLPDRDAGGVVRASAFGTWATITPRELPSDLPPWALRVAAMMPLALALPFVLVLVGLLPDPVAAANPYLTAAAVAWFACALPSPQDFSLLWYAHRVIEGEDVPGRE